jgi:hypothetical protein
MTEYYFLASLLPHLEIGHVPFLGFFELMELLKINLTQEDLQKVERILGFIDLENLRALWTGEPLDPRGNLTKEQLEEISQSRHGVGTEELPAFLFEFLEKYPTPEDRVRQFQLLFTRYLEYEIEREEGFLKNFFSFEREWRLVFIGFRAKKLGKNIDAELQFEDQTDPIVAQILAQKDSKNYEPPFEYKELKPIFEAYADTPLQLHQELYEFRFRRLQEFVEGKHFSIDRILGYLARLYLVEKWQELNVQEGLEIIDTIERNVK